MTESGVKRRIEGLREIVLLLDSVLSWEKEWFPAVTSGTLSLLFLFVWNQDPSLLTFLSVLGLIITILDYALPRLQAKLFPESAWSPDKERKLDQICQELVFVKTGTERAYESLQLYKESSPLIYLTSTVFGLYLLAYIGSLFSGFFIAYLVLLTVCMIPGLHRRGFLKKYCSGIMLKIGEFVKAKKLE